MEIYMYVYILPIKFENSPHPHSIHDCPAVTKIEPNAYIFSSDNFTKKRALKMTAIFCGMTYISKGYQDIVIVLAIIFRQSATGQKESAGQ